MNRPYTKFEQAFFKFMWFFAIGHYALIVVSAIK
jgi:hypothetical protein